MESIYKPGQNCWTVGQASHVSVLIDAANYYQALHQSVSKAKKSIFILGWDIDSRIELLRGKDAAKSDLPTFFDLICSKAKENPALQIYLNKWDYSYFFMKQREPFWKKKWSQCNLPNIHTCLDGILPLGACHHQKIVVIDDELAFWGGMDVALARWDKREHHTENAARADPGGALESPHARHEFGPYHDVQAVAAGPIVADFAKLVRERWKLASSVEPIPPAPDAGGEKLPQSWPEKFPPQFTDARLALARTLPAVKDRKAVHEIRRLYQDEISRAENFIYMENQYFSCKLIAKALNRRLREKPDLRVLMVSCTDPQGMMERKVMWHGRVGFRDALYEGGVEGRTAFVYPACKENGTEKSVHIHSKVMIVDDKFLHIGSSNIADRSMGMDTEFDVSISGADERTQKRIAAIRDDLIREHCGREVADIERIVNEKRPVTDFVEEIKTSRQHFRALDDEIYRHELFGGLARFFGDPAKPLVPAAWTSNPFFKLVYIFGIICAVAAVGGALGLHHAFAPRFASGSVEDMFRNMAHTPASLLFAICLYTMGGVFFFPITAMTGAAVIAFGPLKGVAVAYVGSLLSGVIGWAAGHYIGPERLKNKFGDKIDAVLDKIKGSGIAGVALIRVVPLAPYTLVNMVFGASGVPLLSFIAGTVIGLAPGKLAIALTGHGILKIFEDPAPENFLSLLLGFALWAGVIFISHSIAANRRDREGKLHGS